MLLKMVKQSRKLCYDRAEAQTPAREAVLVSNKLLLQIKAKESPSDTSTHHI